MNEFRISGRLTADPDIKMTNDSKVVARFNFAVTRKFKREGDPDADFFQCVAFGKIAETFEKCNISKGTKLIIGGEVRNNNYEKDGAMVYGTQVKVDWFEFCESKKTESSQTTPAEDGFFPAPGDDSDLPF